MPSVYEFKPRFQAFLRPWVDRLASAGITANEVTIGSMILCTVVGCLMLFTNGSRYALALVPPTLFVRMALNAVDGMLAREHGQKSALGAMLNEICDVASDIVLFMPFAVVPGVLPFAVGIAVATAAGTEVAGLASILAGGSRRYDGPMGKSDRAVAFGLIAALVAAGLSPGAWTFLALTAVSVSNVWTACNRVKASLAETNSSAS